MEQYYILLVGVLFVFALFDLIVGVSNDAVNFLNSAIGAKAAPFWVIMIVASLGILGGALSSDGMMEVARKGIFVPSMFSFHDIMVIFIGVMLTDVLLLNTFNSFGLPTSTTVSIVFELLGGAVSMAILKLNEASKPLSDVLQYINTEKAITVVTGIFMAIVIAFIVGAIIQWIVRMVFSFDYKKAISRWGSLYGGLAITIITYFMLIKGAKHASFMTPDLQSFIKNEILLLWVISIGFWTLLLQILNWVFKINVLKIVVLAGTFSLALAFAGNDLVNFVGVPLAGLSSFDIFSSLGETTGVFSDTFSMDALAGKVETPMVFLLLAGMVMVMTLWLSKKARNVTKTTLNLSSQQAGDEQFGSSGFARVIVRSVVNTSDKAGKFVPQGIKSFVSKRFVIPKETVSTADADKASFDLLRASVNLIVASILITIGTSYKLPLSTTYVTFMVAMATSFADGAWGRETAVYRITGVFTVISGWFLTAFIAFSVTAIIVYVINKGEIYTLAPLFIFAVFVMVKSQIFKSKNAEKQREIDSQKLDTNETNIVTRSYSNVASVFKQVNSIFTQIFVGFDAYNHHELKKAKQKAALLDTNAKKLKDSVSVALHDEEEETSYNYIQVVDYLREIARSITFIADPAFSHVSNNHKPLIDAQKRELHEIKLLFGAYLTNLVALAESNDFAGLEALQEEQNEVFSFISKCRKKQMKRLKNGEVNTRNSLLFIQILHEAKQVLSYSMNVIKSHRDLSIQFNNKI